MHSVVVYLFVGYLFVVVNIHFGNFFEGCMWLFPFLILLKCILCILIWVLEVVYNQLRISRNKVGRSNGLISKIVFLAISLFRVFKTTSTQNQVAQGRQPMFN